MGVELKLQHAIDKKEVICLKDLLKIALDEAKRLGADYADARYLQRKNEPITTKNGAVQHMALLEDKGFGVRVLANGGWGFSSSNIITPAELKRCAAEAVAIARASAKVQKEPVTLSPLKPVQDTYKTKVKLNPFEVPLSEKLDLLKSLDKEMKSDEKVKVTTSSLNSLQINKLFISTEGSVIEQEIVETGVNISATAAGNGDVQRRSFSDYSTAGYEFIKGLKLKDMAGGLGKEAVELLTAESCPKTETSLILGSSILALQIHESCGHPIELDRVLGTEASYAGTSFLMPDMLGNYQYGSEDVTIVADATVPGGLGTFGYDDEGVPAQRTTIVDKGLFVNYLTSRETASTLGQVSNGTMRADSWSNIPLVRMVNISLDPGDWTLDEIIKDTKDGVFMEAPKSWSLDDKRLNFHFSTEYAYEIKDGSITKLLKNPAYTDMTTHFWNACDAVSGKGADEWHLWGMPSCAKGEPIQIANVAHGAAPARFKDIKVGVGK
jgi:TldD protein